jgi:hypothetical protein
MAESPAEGSAPAAEHHDEQETSRECAGSTYWNLGGWWDYAKEKVGYSISIFTSLL